MKYVLLLLFFVLPMLLRLMKRIADAGQTDVTKRTGTAIEDLRAQRIERQKRATRRKAKSASRATGAGAPRRLVKDVDAEDEDDTQARPSERFGARQIGADWTVRKEQKTIADKQTDERLFERLDGYPPMRKAIVLMEIFSPPVIMRPPRF